MKYSIIIPYRDRQVHLNRLVPRLRELFPDGTEIIVSEQNDDDIFLRGNVKNAGAQHAKGDILIFHDVDHYPIEADYDPPEGVDIWLPIKRVGYVDNDLIALDDDEIPSGYVHFKEGVDDNFFGGVLVFRREAFFKINGFSSLYRGWGLEDDDIRERCKHYGLNIQRGDGDFYALHHENSDPGTENSEFQRSQALYSRWAEFLEAGVNTQFQTTAVFPTLELDWVNTDSAQYIEWIRSTNFVTTTPAGTAFMTMDGVTELYEDTPEIHVKMFKTFELLVSEHDQLKGHRDWVTQNNFGYGETAFHWMWHLICREFPEDFKFLEIGVFKGQMISLMSLLNFHHKKKGMIYGITPLTNAGDKYSKHPEVDYEAHIQRIYQTFGLDASDLGIIQGFSDDPEIIETALEIGPFDAILVDGCHDYEVVVSDIINYAEMIKPGGLMVIDDANNYLKIPDGLIRMDWRGLEDVSNAVRDTIEKNDNFIELFAVGHNRIWKKV